MIDILV